MEVRREIGGANAIYHRRVNGADVKSDRMSVNAANIAPPMAGI